MTMALCPKRSQKISPGCMVITPTRISVAMTGGMNNRQSAINAEVNVRRMQEDHPGPAQASIAMDIDE
jgi:hypothetical protein